MLLSALGHILTKKSTKCYHQSCSFSLKYGPKLFSAGALLQTPLAELTALPQPAVLGRSGAPK